MMRFSIRDLLWTTLVVAMGLGWWISYRAIDAKLLTTDTKRLEAVGQAQWHRHALIKAKTILNIVESWNPPPGRYIPHVDTIDWTVLDEPLVEP